MRRDVVLRQELYDKYIIDGYSAGKSVEEIAVSLGIKPQKVKHIAHTLGITKRWKHTRETFIEEAKKIHGGVYTYDKVVYDGNKIKVVITCPKHGDFLQTPHMHISKKMQGCTSCSVSSPHRKIITFLDSLGIEYTVNDRKLLSGLELDILIPNNSLAIEINGEYYHTVDKLGGDKYYHYNKYKRCNEIGVRLLQFWGNEVSKKPTLVFSMIKNSLGLIDNKIAARNCKVVEVDSKSYRSFLNENHLEGEKNSGIKLGLESGGELVSVMGFSKYSSHYELDRFCSKSGVVVIGGFSKLLSRSPTGRIVSYSFNRYSTGQIYKSHEFILTRENKTSLFYYHKGELKNRNQFMKYKLAKKLGIANVDMYTEKELALMLGAYQVFDAGTRTWVLEKVTVTVV
jgi:hypothetical protein